MNTKQFEKVFPVGSHLCREPMPAMSEMKKDMEILKKHGFNLIKLQEHWAIDEPLEGHYDFSKYETLIEYAEKLDMGVYLGLTCEQAPHWLWEKHPDCRMVGRNGLPIYYEAQSTVPTDGKPGPCFDHPGASADQARFIRKLVQTLGAYENVVVWNVWQEIGYWAEQPVCYCENTLNFFREWLKEKYSNLDGLNRAWNTSHLDWHHVLPNRTPGKCCLPQNIDWSYFMENVKITRTLKERLKVIKEADPLKRPVFAHKGGPLIGSGVDWSYADAVDFLGSSTYPASAWGSSNLWDDVYPAAGQSFERHSALLYEMWERLALRFDYIRSCNKQGKDIWAAEFQGGPACSVFVKGRVPSADDIRRWMLTGIGSGISGISFWVTRAEIAGAEANGFSLLDSEGETSERLEEASRIGKGLNKHADLFGEPTLTRARVGIVINEWNYRFCTTANADASGGHLSYSIRGWHRLLWDIGISVDFIEVSELGQDYVGEYKALILPFPVSISEDVVKKLEKYVEQGGNLISEACAGRFNEHAFCNRGELSPAARKLFGVSQTSLTMVREPEKDRRWSAKERTWGEYLDAAMLSGAGPFQDMKVRANVYIETFECQGSKPFLMYGEAIVGTLREVGRGKAWLLGTIVGHNGTAYRDDETKKYVRSLLAQCGVFPEHKGKLLLRKRATKDKEAWIFTNPTEEEVTERITVGKCARVEELNGESIKHDDGCFDLKIKSLDVKIIVIFRN